MAQLKDLLVNGATRLIGDVFTNKIQITSISAPTSAGGSTYGTGTNGQVLKSNGTSIYWGTDSNSGMVITLTLSGSTYTADKTYDEINTALSSGIDCCVVYNSMQYPFISRRNSSSSFYFDFCKIDASQYGVQKDGFTISKDGNNTRVQSYYSNASIPSIPDPIAPSTILELVQNDDDPPNWVINGSPIEDIEFCFNGEGTWTPIIILRKHVVDFENYYPPINGDTENYYLSKLYTTYEPTIIGGFEEYIITGYLVFQAIVNDNGIKKIKTITVSDEFFQYDYLANATITFSEEAVDTTHRCCSATLSSAGWYRVLHIANPTGSISRVIDLTITRNYVNANNESHCIKYIGNYNSHSFNDEVSKSNTILVDKVRYTTDSNYGYVDIHYAGTSANKIAVDFECYADIGLKQSCVAESLQSVADAPSGETVLVSYDFHADISSTVKDISSAVTLNYGYDPLQKWIYVHDGMVDMFIETYFASYVADNEYIIGTITSPYRPDHLIVTTGHTTDSNFNPKGLVNFIVYTNGNLGVRVNNTTGNYIIVHATYSIF